VLPSLVAGALFALTVPPLSWWPLVLPGAALLWWRLGGLSLRERLLAGFALGVAWFGPTLWFTEAFTGFGYAALVVGEAAIVAAPIALVPKGRGRALALPGAVVLGEAARESWPFGGLPLGSLALGQASGPLLPAARLGGHLFVEALAVAAGVALGELCCAVAGLARPGALGRRRALRTLATASAVVALVAAFDAAGRLAPDGGPKLGSIRVAAVQGGGPRGFRQNPTSARLVYERQVLPTLRLRPPLDVVLWPEDVVALDGPLRGSLVAEQLGSLARWLRATLVAGVTEPVGATRFRNEAVAFGPSGRIVASYEKVHRVPFGEYVPGRALLAHLFNLSAVPRDAIPGRGPGILRTPAGPLGVMISYEVFFAGRGLAAVHAGGEVLVVPTNDASYASDQAPSQEVAADRLRAVEDGRALVQAAPTGYSTVVNRHGRVLHRTRLSAQAVILATVPLYGGATPYSAGPGDWPVRAGAAAALLGGWWLAARDRRSRAARLGLPPRSLAELPGHGAEPLRVPPDRVGHTR
jgi:apolipoprotein N-acyltransferase